MKKNTKNLEMQLKVSALLFSKIPALFQQFVLFFQPSKAWIGIVFQPKLKNIIYFPAQEQKYLI